MLSKTKQKLIEEVYCDPKCPGSLGGIARLWKYVKTKISKIRKIDIVNFLKGRREYTLHKQQRIRFKRNRVYVSRIDQQWEADLVDMSCFSKTNNNIRYLLTVIDVLSKFAWAIPVHRKDAATICSAFRKLFRKAFPRRPERIHTDKGKEFYNSQVRNLLNQLQIKHFSTNSETKASIVERFNRTLKSRMWRYFTARNTHKWIDIIGPLLHGYNLSAQRSIGVPPAKVNKRNELKIWRRLYGGGGNQKLEKGTYVRISVKRQTFDKAYLAIWSEKVFKVVGVVSNRIPTYLLQDLEGQLIKGSFYREELQEIRFNPKKHLYRIEKILKTAEDPITGKTKYFIKWLGYPSSANSWITKDDIQRI